MAGTHQARRSAPVAARRLRSLTFATTAATLAVAAHAAGGGGWPDTGTVVIVTVLVAAAANVYVGRRTSLVTVVAGLAGAQLAMHLMLDAGSSQHDMAASVVTGWWVLAVHMVVTLLTAVLLTTADDAVRVVAAAVRSMLPALPEALPTVETVASRPVHAPEAENARQATRRVTCTRRGPPHLAES